MSSSNGNTIERTKSAAGKAGETTSDVVEALLGKIKKMPIGRKKSFRQRTADMAKRYWPILTTFGVAAMVIKGMKNTDS